MTDAAVVREEVWFDSADGASRVHGYVWWPEGMADEAIDSETPDGAAEHGDADPVDAPEGALHEEGSDSSSRGEGTVEDQEPGAHHAPRHAASVDDGGDASQSHDDVDDDISDEGDDDEQSDPLGESQEEPLIVNALERAARASAIMRADDATRHGGEERDDGAIDRAPDDGEGGTQVAPIAPEPLVDDALGEGRRGAAEDPIDRSDGSGDGAQGRQEDDEVGSDAIEVKGIVQLVHGMAEHIGRYDEFARFLADHGYIVCGHDHIGHGKSADPDRLGCLPARHGKDILIEDVGRLRSIMQERVGEELPYFLFGHSLGSFVVRAYIARGDVGLAGAIICGTGHVSSSKSSLGHFAARFLGVFHGQYGKSRLLHSMGVGAYVKAVKHRRKDNDWLSYNEANVDAYDSDALCGFPFSAGGYATVTSLTKEVCSASWASRVPRLLPLLFIGGNADPVGDNGEGVRLSARLVRDAGCADVTCMIYKHMRHEILNEDDRQMVFDDILFWLEVRS